MTEKKKEYKTEVATVGPTVSQRFTNMVIKEFGNVAGTLALTPYQQKLAQHMFVAIDNQLNNLEAKRLDAGGKGTEITWPNINMQKLALDAVHRIELGLDALIPNHLHPIPYFNKRLKKYDLDLRVGYAGKDCYRRKVALDEPIEIFYELVHEKDKFVPIKKGANTEVETYTFNITNPFDRGKIVGGFGYIIHEDPRKNKLIIVTRADFDKSKKLAKSDTFWSAHPDQMMYKTLVHRVTSHLPMDPEKINASVHAVESVDAAAELADMQIEADANGEIIDIKDEAPLKYFNQAGDEITGTEEVPQEDINLNAVEQKEPKETQAPTTFEPEF